MLPESDSELWVDLLSLVSSSCVENGFITIYYQYVKNSLGADETITYALRVALRALKYKITKIECIYNDECELRQKSYFTNIPPDIWNDARKLESEWIQETYVDDGYYSSDSDESVSDSDESVSVVQEQSNEDPVIC